MTDQGQITSHWADVVADKIIRAGRPPVVSTGISPSGEIHIGNMREVLTGDAVFRALQDRGINAGFNYVADNFDPLRKVYPFLEPEVYGPLVGRPLSEIRCPCGDHASYSEHFLEPFLQALADLGIEVEVERSDQMYKSGRMTPYIVQALEARDLIAEILRERTGKQVTEEWSPFNPLCPACGQINQAKVTGFDARDQVVHYACDCGSEGDVPMAGGGKLVWRVDWPARWMMLGVTVEPFGKDHATPGGSYETGERIVREVFGGEPPFPIPYEWIRLKGRGDMSSSKGNVLAISYILEVVPPEALRYLVIRARPNRTINFDPGLPLLQLVDEIDDVNARNRDERSVDLSQAGGFRPVGIPFKHLVVVSQAAHFDLDEVMEILARSGYAGADREAVASRLTLVRRWLERFAPEEMRFAVCEDLPAVAKELDADQRAFLASLAEKLSGEMDGEGIYKLVYDLAVEYEATKPAALFQAIYLSLLGKARGPRAGSFITVLGPEFCAERFRQASAQS